MDCSIVAAALSTNYEMEMTNELNVKMMRKVCLCTLTSGEKGCSTLPHRPQLLLGFEIKMWFKRKILLFIKY